MTDQTDLSQLADCAERLVAAARSAGADAADAVVVHGTALSVDVREGKVEETERSESADLGLRVFVGRRSAVVSANMTEDPGTLADRAVAMAKVAPEDPFAGLADRDRLGQSEAALDLEDAVFPDADVLTSAAHRVEAAMLDVAGVTRSGGASASASSGGVVLVTSDGFSGGYRVTRHGRGASAIAGDGTRMERDYWSEGRVHLADMPEDDWIGARAGERAVRRLEPEKITTRKGSVVFEPRIASSLVGHLLGAINAAAVARKTSFLQSKMGEKIFADGVTITDDPFRPRGLASRPFDGEGIAGGPLELVENGVLKSWLLDSASARELGLESNGRARRGVGAPSPGPTNVTLAAGQMSREELLREIGDGLFVTELIGQGVNLVTGDYSRGAAGFWIEAGEIAYPVSEITIAGNLGDMFLNMIVADDLEENRVVNTPTIAIKGMTIAGR
ncbi:TldD/PmbA family protein [Amorphus orientalis]|uniref:PmbA protein n=1 Tax=Amorphus orientalis TaxID=649198 RepID=A0AAE3VRB7_9HYPH|nr:TldD/PmbA family protein [Amorphus orientalis]MDQ0316726.1 PmbA protein [Amorphus orientalis]